MPDTCTVFLQYIEIDTKTSLRGIGHACDLFIESNGAFRPNLNLPFVHSLNIYIYIQRDIGQLKVVYYMNICL